MTGLSQRYYINKMVEGVSWMREYEKDRHIFSPAKLRAFEEELVHPTTSLAKKSQLEIFIRAEKDKQQHVLPPDVTPTMDKEGLCFGQTMDLANAVFNEEQIYQKNKALEAIRVFKVADKGGDTKALVGKLAPILSLDLSETYKIEDLEKLATLRENPTTIGDFYRNLKSIAEIEIPDDNSSLYEKESFYRKMNLEVLKIKQLQAGGGALSLSHCKFLRIDLMLLRLLMNPLIKYERLVSIFLLKMTTF